MRDHGAATRVRTALLIALAIAATLLGLVAANHSDIGHVTASVGESVHSIDEQAGVVAGGCLLLAACCVIGLAIRRLVPTTRAMTPAPSPWLPVAEPPARRRRTPSLQQLSVYRT